MEPAGGGVAQLVEYLNGIQGVRGSTPLTSTTVKGALGRLSCFSGSDGFVNALNTRAGSSAG